MDAVTAFEVRENVNNLKGTSLFTGKQTPAKSPMLSFMTAWSIAVAGCRP